MHEVIQGASADGFDPAYDEKSLQVMLISVSCDEKYLTSEHIQKSFIIHIWSKIGSRSYSKNLNLPWNLILVLNTETEKNAPDGTFDVEEEEVMNSLTNVGLSIALHKYFHMGKLT